MKAWLGAMRLRTLPLALSSIIVGCALSYRPTPRYWQITGLALLTATLLQILSNFANDYGDFVKGTDDDTRVGPTRALQSGAITPASMRIAMVLVALLCLCSGVALLYKAFPVFDQSAWIMLAIGIASIGAAILYTVGKKAYGYHGFGDLFVFLFFGLVGVAGTYFVHRHSIESAVWLPACSLGLFSAAVLNLNNMRDMLKDQAKGKITLAVRMGTENAKTYHAFLIIAGWLLITLFFLYHYLHPVQLLMFLPSIIFARHLKFIIGQEQLEAIDPELKKVALGTFAFSICFAISLISVFYF